MVAAAYQTFAGTCGCTGLAIDLSNPWLIVPPIHFQRRRGRPDSRTGAPGPWQARGGSCARRKARPRTSRRTAFCYRALSLKSVSVPDAALRARDRIFAGKLIMDYKVAVVGATGNVGREMLDVLAERRFPAEEVVALAPRRSQDRRLLRVRGEYHATAAPPRSVMNSRRPTECGCIQGRQLRRPSPPHSFNDWKAIGRYSWNPSYSVPRTH